ncbi:MAG: hypothetical protein NTY75_01915 [Candidatus Shapirobacteria bacterium]|nr:hypothetical protein [Candidatus Shapirobacteria bacterium]
MIGLIGAGFGGFVVRSEIEKARIKAVNSKKNKVRLPMVIKPGQVGPTGYERTPTNGSDFSLRVKNRPSLFSILQGIITRADVKITDGPPDSGVTSIDVRGSITDGDEAEIFFRSPHSSEPRGASKVTRSQRNEHYMNELLDAMKKK